MLKKAVLGIIKEFAGNTLIETLGPYLNDIKNEAINAARDTIESAVTGRRTLDEWAEIVITGVDKVKDKIIEDNSWQYVGGKLNFAMSEKNANKVVISFELYFLDEEKKWQKVGAESDVFASNFTLEALEDIKSNDCVSFEVE